MAGIVGTGVGGEGFGWSLPLSLGSRCVIFFSSFLNMLTQATTPVHTIYGSLLFKGLLFAAPKVWSRGNEVSSSSRNSSRRTHKVALAPAPWARTPGFLIYGLLHI